MPRADKGRRRPTPAPSAPSTNEINEELADDVDREDGTITQETAEELGALNVEAVRANRTRQDAVAQKRGGGKRVAWGEENACLLYDSIIQLYPPTSMAVQVQRLTGGAPATWYLQSQPLNGRELYDHIGSSCHGRAAESTYKVTFVDGATQHFRGVGRITFPSTIGVAGSSAPLSPQPMMPQPAPPWPQQAPHGFFPSPAGAPAAVVAAPVAAAPAPAGPDLTQALALQRQLSEMQHQIALIVQGRAPAAAAPPPPAAPTPQPAALPFAIPPGHVLVVGPNGQQLIVPTSQIGFAGAPAAAAAAPAAAQPPLTPAQQFAASIGMIRQAVGAADEIRRIVPDALTPAAAAAPATPPEDESYIKATKVGDINILQNRDDGGFLPFETLLANGDKVMQWVREQKAILTGQQPPAQPNGQAGAPVGAMAPPSIPVQGP